MPNEAAIRARHSGAAANIQRRDAPAAEAYRINSVTNEKKVTNVTNENNVSNETNNNNAKIKYNEKEDCCFADSAVCFSCNLAQAVA